MLNARSAPTMSQIERDLTDQLVGRSSTVQVLRSPLRRFAFSLKPSG
jgi:hypothetical protein